MVVHWAKVEIGALRWSTGTCAESHGELSEGGLRLKGSDGVRSRASGMRKATSATEMFGELFLEQVNLPDHPNLVIRLVLHHVIV